MTGSIELQVISKILTSDDEAIVDELCSYDSSYYAVCNKQIEFILEHREKYGSVPDRFTFDAEFPKFDIVAVNEPLEFLVNELKKNKRHILFLETFNKLKEMGSADVDDAWGYMAQQLDVADSLNTVAPMNIIQQSQERSDQVVAWSKQTRIPTGFAELDKLCYGGLSTVEELLVFVGRSNVGKSWCLTKMGEAANRAGFNVAYYSPEMQAAYLATRIDTWRGHYQNSKLFTGQYTQEYIDYIKSLPQETNADFYIIEDKDMPDGVSPRHLASFVKKHNIQILLIDGISYMVDDRKGFSDHEKYGNICHDLFQLSKKYGCAVVLAAQANRETKDSKDDKGVPFPTIYNIAGSDAIGQIATQVYAIRQIFDKHVFEIRLEKSRMALNENNTLSYSWDVNNGNMQYLPGGPDEDPMITAPEINTSELLPSTGPVPDIIQGLDLTDDDDSGLEW